MPGEILFKKVLPTRVMCVRHTQHTQQFTSIIDGDAESIIGALIAAAHG